MQADAGQNLAQSSELSVLWSEVVSPLADTVGFVNGDKADVARREEGQEVISALADEAFGGNIEKAVATLAQSRDHGRLLVGGQRAVEERRWYAVADQCVDLILHQ